MGSKLSATSRDPEEWAARTHAARAARAAAAAEVVETMATQVEALIVEGDLMGGRAMVADRISKVVAAEKTGDSTLVRAAWIDLAVAAGACVAAIDYVPPASPAKPEDDEEPAAA